MRKDKSFIFTTLSVIGVGLTVLSTIKDTTKACKLIDEKMELKEKIKKTWKCYIPSGIVATTTILCIVYSDHISQKEKASLIAALMATQNNYANLRNSINEVCDDDLKNKINNKVIDNKIPKELYIERTGEKLFYEEYTCNFFISTIDAVLKAEYAFNKQLSVVGYATLNDFYGFLGICETEAGEYLGWSVYKGVNKVATVNPWVDFVHEKMEDDDGVEYHYINYSNQPTVNYDMF